MIQMQRLSSTVVQAWYSIQANHRKPADALPRKNIIPNIIAPNLWHQSYAGEELFCSEFPVECNCC